MTAAVPTRDRTRVGRKKSLIPTKTVRIDEDVHDLATQVSALEGIDASAFLSALLRPILKDALLKHARKIVQDCEKLPKK